MREQAIYPMIMQCDRTSCSKNSKNVQDFNIGDVNNCYKFCFISNNHNYKKEREIPQHARGWKQTYAQERNKMRAVAGQGCTPHQPSFRE